jgi:hypothetical protein
MKEPINNKKMEAPVAYLSRCTITLSIIRHEGENEYGLYLETPWRKKRLITMPGLRQLKEFRDALAALAIEHISKGGQKQ